MTVTTNDCSARKSKALLGPDDVNDSLTLISKTKIGNSKLFDIVLEG